MLRNECLPTRQLLPPTSVAVTLNLIFSRVQIQFVKYYSAGITFGDPRPQFYFEKCLIVAKMIVSKCIERVFFYLTTHHCAD